MKKKYLDQLHDLGRSSWRDDCKTIDELRNHIKEIFESDSKETTEKFLIKLNQRKAREQLNAN